MFDLPLNEDLDETKMEKLQRESNGDITYTSHRERGRNSTLNIRLL